MQIEGPYVVARGAVDVGAWTSENDDEMSVGEFCAETLKSVGEVEVSKPVNLGGDSVAELLGKEVYRAKIASGGAATEEIMVGSRNSLRISRSTPVNLTEEKSRGSMSLTVTPVRSPLKRASNLMFTVNESI